MGCGSWARRVKAVDEVVGPGPALGDPQPGAAGGAGDPGGDVQQPVAQLLGFGGGEVAVQEEASGSRRAGRCRSGRVRSQAALIAKNAGREPAGVVEAVGEVTAVAGRKKVLPAAYGHRRRLYVFRRRPAGPDSSPPSWSPLRRPSPRTSRRSPDIGSPMAPAPWCATPAPPACD